MSSTFAARSRTFEKESKIANLKDEINLIHAANYEYWTLAEGEHSRQSRAAHDRRRIRLAEIRRQFIELK